MVSRTHSATLVGVEGQLIEIEAATERSLPALHITGLPGPIVKESRERIRVCLGHLGFPIPSGRVVIHLLPASAPKQGSHLDLAIALAVLGAESCLEGISLERFGFLGELTMDGRIQNVSGALALAQALGRRPGIETILVPAANGAEVALLKDPRVRVAEHLGQILDFLRGKGALAVPDPTAPPGRPPGHGLNGVQHQPLAKRALQIALAGNHSLLMMGPPGVGKTMLAQAAPSLLPDLDPLEWLSVMKNHAFAVAELPDWSRPPFRSPHHSVSASALLGGGSGTVIPGEVTLAHGGILFLDEIAEFRREALEGLREPLQNGVIHLHRIGHAVTLPARFLLIAAMNPCRCGYSLSGKCRCSSAEVMAYRRKISGPLLDRFDLCVVLGSPRGGEDPPDLEETRVVASVERVRSRKGEEGDPGEEVEAWLRKKRQRDEASGRAVARLRRLASTLSALEEEPLSAKHLDEAWSLRCPESFHRLLGF